MLNAKLKFPAKRRKVSAFSLQPLAFVGSAFTLIEMLMVISVLGILAALTVPALKNLGKSNAALAASRQMLGAVAAGGNWPSPTARRSIWFLSRRIFGWLNSNFGRGCLPTSKPSSPIYVATN